MLELVLQFQMKEVDFQEIRNQARLSFLTREWFTLASDLDFTIIRRRFGLAQTGPDQTSNERVNIVIKIKWLSVSFLW